VDRNTQNALTIAKFTAYAGVLAGIVMTGGENQSQALMVWVAILASASVRHFRLYDTPQEKHAPWTFLLEVGMATVLSRLGYAGLDVVLFFVIISESAISCRTSISVLLTLMSAIGLGLARWPAWGMARIAIYVGINGAALVFAFAVSFAIKRETERRTELGSLLEQLEKSKQELESTYGELVESQARLQEMAVMEERSRMAREIHDTLAHSLTAIIVTLEAARRKLGHGDVSIDADLEGVQEQARVGLDEVRRSIAEMRPAALARGSFYKALQILLEQVEKWHGVRTQLRVPQVLPELRPEQEVALFRLVQEATTNAVRHGKCSAVKVELSVDQSQLVLSVGDDGQGCGNIVPGNGLYGMSERIAAVGGTVDFESSTGQGFHIAASLPLRGEANVQN
jgi:signal transduction histidine kinase